MMSFEEFAADLPLAHTQWFTSPSALEKAMEEYGICQPTRQAARGEFKAGLAVRQLLDSELFSDRYSTALSLHCESPDDGIGILLPRSPSGHFVVNGVDLGNDHLVITPKSEGMDIAGPGPIGSDCIALSETGYRELVTADSGEESVTAIALRNGFNHLGRFSVAYHVRFGEMPSETLTAQPGALDS